MSGPAATVWRSSNQVGEYSLITADAIVDSSGVALVDSSSVAIVSGDSTFTPIPTTVWNVNDTA